jgi:hypothetical protein
VWWLRPKLWRQKNWLLQHNNAPSHTSFFTREFFYQKITWLSSPSHPTRLTSPPMTLCFPDWR